MTQRTRVQTVPFVAFAFLLSGVFIYFGLNFCVAKMIGEPISVDNGGMPVAKWDVSVDSTDSNSKTVLANGAEQSYTFTVMNDSDVASNYAITVSNIPNGVKVGLDQGELEFASDGTIVFSGDDFELGPSPNEPKEHTLKVLATLDAAVGATDIQIHVDFTQKEPEL